ncbi:MAG: hypothetical protein FJ298_05915 [Planctomycetes bacterium]|nr:hypothetical protein [Planctomycetota bacterium]
MSTSGATAGGQTGGAIVAALQLTVPSPSSYVVRGTVPVPKGTFPRADGKIPLSIRDIDGFVAPTQMEIVSRYPNDADGADVVEVLARVRRPVGVAAGTKVRYDVVQHLHANGKLTAKKAVLDLLALRDQVAVVAKDVFGNEYRFYPFDGVRTAPVANSVKALRVGPAAVETRTYGVMKPVGATLGAPSGALPHFFGVHAYTTVWSNEDFVSLDLRVNNGASGANKTPGFTNDDPLGLVYFRSLELHVPAGWSILSDISDPYQGTPATSGNVTKLELVKPMADGTLHVMPAQAMFHRRLALALPTGVSNAVASLEKESVGFCVKGSSPAGAVLWSWWNPQTSRYFPQRLPLPDLSHLGQSSIQGNVAGFYNTIRGHLQNGTASGGYPWSFPNFGWAHIYGVQYGGMTSGSEIWFFDGFKTASASSREGYRSYEFSHRMYSERQPQLLMNSDGEQTRVEQWVVQTSTLSYTPMNYFQRLTNNSNDPFGMNVSPAFQRNHVAANNLKPAYETDIVTSSPIDFQHYIRFLRSPMVLTWLGNDSIAKDDLRMAAECFRMSFSEHFNNSSGYSIPSTLRAKMSQVSNLPNRGFSFGRGESWGMVSAICAYSISDSAFRARYRPWFGTIADVIANGQSSCNGFIQSWANTKLLSGQWKGRQSIEQAITENMLWGLKESVFRGVDAARVASVENVLVKSTAAMIGPMAWNGTGPWSHLAVAPLDSAQQPFCGSIPSGGGGNGNDNYQTPSSYAYGYMLTGNATFLTRAAQAQAGGSANLLTALQGQGYNNLENKAALMSVLQ